MKDNIEKLKIALKNKHTEIEKIEGELEAMYNIIFDDSYMVKEGVKNLENSDFFLMSEFQDISQIVDFNLEAFKLDNALKYLEVYLKENHCIDIDEEQGTISQYIGPAIIINHGGDVLDQDSGKWVISVNDYSSEEELHQLIEEHMEKTGCYPGTFRQGYCGSLTIVDTSKKTKE